MRAEFWLTALKNVSTFCMHVDDEMNCLDRIGIRTPTLSSLGEVIESNSLLRRMFGFSLITCASMNSRNFLNCVTHALPFSSPNSLSESAKTISISMLDDMGNLG